MNCSPRWLNAGTILGRLFAVWCGAVTLPGICLQAEAAPVSDAWQKEVSELVWVAYFPTQANPKTGVEATRESIETDFALLRRAKFTALVTYGSSGVLGRELPAIAEAAGFRGLIVGVWDPKNAGEIAAAISVAKSTIVLGYCVGNEGLNERYSLKELAASIDALRVATGKPVTTTEQIEDYESDELLQLGDWVFPNVHPYFHHEIDPIDAVPWTANVYTRLKRKSARFIFFKEVGLPTDGDPTGKLSESNQDKYYAELAKTPTRFVYFEAFDLPWKDHPPVEPHWGLFRADRSPKVLGQRLLGMVVPPAARASPPILAAPPAARGSPPILAVPFFIYEDARSEKNHFAPSGYMGDCGDIQVNEAFDQKPHSGKTCIRIVYEAMGKGPHTCSYPPPCKFAGIYWQEPANNWGTEAALKGKGLDLSSYNRLVFWARADKECKIEFKVGGIEAAYGDSLGVARTKAAQLKADWQEFEIDLRGANLKHVIGGFGWTSNWETTPGGVTFYLDDIRFDKQ